MQNNREASWAPGQLWADSNSNPVLTERRHLQIQVSNTGDRPIQIGSHFHFFEVNRALNFDRTAAYGMRLAIRAGTAVRFEPGQTQSIDLVELGGDRVVYGLGGLCGGRLDDEKVRQSAFDQARSRGYLGVD